MTRINKLHQYSDECGNKINVTRTYDNGINVDFRGNDNVINIADGANIGRLNVSFDGNSGRLDIGHNRSSGWLQFNIRIGEDSSVLMGDNVSTTAVCTISAVEGTTIRIGNDVMIASDNQIRADDGHAIFDVMSGNRINMSRDIHIDNHVWLAYGACVLAGSKIGSGSVIGFRSVVTGTIPNNVIAVGSPARVTRRNIAWERPHLSLTDPAYKPHINVMEKSEEFWSETLEEAPVTNKKSLLSRLLKGYK